MSQVIDDYAKERISRLGGPLRYIFEQALNSPCWPINKGTATEMCKDRDMPFSCWCIHCQAMFLEDKVECSTPKNL